MIRPIFLMLLMASPLVLMAWPPGAASAAEGADLDAEAVQNHLDRGTVFYKQGNFQAALREFEAIDGYFRTHGDHPTFRWYLADCLARAGRPMDALESYALLADAEIAEGTRQAARERIEGLRRTALGGLTLACVPARSTVEIDDVTTVPLPCPIERRDFPSGTYTFRVLSPGDVTTVQKLRVAPGRPNEATITVTPELVVRSPVAGAYVQVDGRFAGEAGPQGPLVLRDVEPGAREIRVTSPRGGKPWIKRVKVSVGERTVASAELDGQRLSLGGDVTPIEAEDDDTLLWVGVGVGAAALVAGGAAAFLLLGEDDPEVREGLQIRIE